MTVEKIFFIVVLIIESISWIFLGVNLALCEVEKSRKDFVWTYGFLSVFSTITLVVIFMYVLL